MRFFESMVVVAVTGGALLAACGNSGDAGGGGGDAGVDGSTAACSTDTTSDVHHCGDCSTDCTTLPHVDASKVTCAKSECVTYPACAAGYADCSTTAPGCETALGTKQDCAACGDVCSYGTPVCSAGKCAATCTAPYGDTCGGSCVDTQTDVDNCGACGVVCTADAGGQRAACVAGTCQSQCAGGLHECGGTCVSTESATACGASCAVCPGAPFSDPVCIDGACELACATGAHRCSGSCVDDHAVATCGASCSPCTPLPPGSTTTCNGTSCGYTCDAGYADCDGLASNACEVNVTDDPRNCGACGHACVGTCSGGTCQPLERVGGPGPYSIAAVDSGWYVVSPFHIQYITFNDTAGESSSGDYADIVADDASVFWSSASGALSYGATDFAGEVAIPVPAGHAPTSLAITALAGHAPTLSWTDSSGNLLATTPGQAQAQIVAATGAAAGTCAISVWSGEAPVWFETAEGNLWRWDGVNVGAVSLLARTGGPGAALAVDASYVYTGNQNGTVARIPKTGGTLQPLTTRPSPVASLLSSGSDLYILTDTALEKYNLAAGTIATLANIGATGSRCHALGFSPSGILFAASVQGVPGVYVLSP